MRGVLDYLAANHATVLAALLRHAGMTGVALLIALGVALPLGVALARRPRLAGGVLGALGVLYTVPSLALLILLVPLFGINERAVTAALVLYMQAILVRNVVAGLRSVDPAVLEAADAMGFGRWQRLARVELPLALPVILAGVRLAAVVGIGIATIGAKFNAGGLGTLLFEGIAQAGRADKIWAGALVVGALALGVHWVLLAAEKAAARPRRRSA